MPNERNCNSCIWIETFKMRAFDPSGMGCKQPNWSGYILNPSEPPCGGIAWSAKEVSDAQSK
jgi:hypothetical protein